MADNAGDLSREPGPRLRVAQVNDIAAVGSTLARAMNRLGVEARLIEPWRPASRLRYPWKAAALPLRAAGIVGAGLAVKRGGFDVVHVHFARLGMIGELGGRPYTLHVHGSDIRGVMPGSLWGRETAPFMRRARLVYYATPDLREWVEPFRRDAIFLPNPIETDVFVAAAAKDAETAAESAGGSSAETADGSSGAPHAPVRRDLLVGVRLSAIKGLPAILETLRHLARSRPATTITIVAQGEGVASAVAAAGSAAIVVPRTPREELPALLRGHRLALGQLLVGAIGNYELECLASGVPVVTRFDYEGVYPSPPPIVAAASGEEAAAQIARLLDDDAALSELAGRGPAWVEANHSAVTIAGRVLADYERTGQVRAH
jgi:glycosyltransferase involved in cell wall biosynthesis